MNVLIEKVGTIPAGLCFRNWDDMLTRFIEAMQGTIPGIGAFTIISKDPPDASLAGTVLWLRLDPMSGLVTKTYHFQGGLWISEHAVPPLSSVRWMFIGTKLELRTFDGGEDIGELPATLMGGPMWEVDEDFAGRVPLAPGTMPSTDVIAVGDTGGVEESTLLLENLPAHRHKIGVSGAGVASEGDDVLHQGGGNTIQYVQNQSQPNVGFTRNAGGDEGETDTPTVPHSNLPPYLGTYMIKRTARRFYTVTI